MYLWLTHAQSQALLRHAHEARPNEACGLISGRQGQAQQVVPIHNVAPQPQIQYQLDPAEQIRAMSAFQQAGLELTAIYHSHPNGEPIPSQTDIREANYPDSIYLIIGFTRGETRLAAWHIHGGRVDSVPIHIGPTAPEYTPQTMTHTQRASLIITAILSALFVIAYAIYLLPPAPPIPTPGG